MSHCNDDMHFGKFQPPSSTLATEVTLGGLRRSRLEQAGLTSRVWRCRRTCSSRFCPACAKVALDVKSAMWSRRKVTRSCSSGCPALAGTPRTSGADFDPERAGRSFLPGWKIAAAAQIKEIAMRQFLNPLAIVALLCIGAAAMSAHARERSFITGNAAPDQAAEAASKFSTVSPLPPRPRFQQMAEPPSSEGQIGAAPNPGRVTGHGPGGMRPIRVRQPTRHTVETDFWVFTGWTAPGRGRPSANGPR